MSKRAIFVLALAGLSSIGALLAQTPARHPLTLDDIARLAEVRDPQCSTDGGSVAYVVSTIDVKEDKSTSHIWMVGFDGKDDRQITFSQEASLPLGGALTESTWRSRHRGPERRRAVRCGCSIEMGARPFS